MRKRLQFLIPQYNEDEKILKTVMKGGNTKETIGGTKIYKLRDYL